MTRQEFAPILKQYMESHDRFIIAGHEGPDGDCIGAAVALGLALRNMGKEVYTFYDRYSETCKEREIAQLLPRLSLEEAEEASNTPYAFILVDASEDHRLGKGRFLIEKAADFLSIDHHVQFREYDRMAYVEAHIIATCEILFYLFKEADIPISGDMAKALFLGLVTDTGGFRHAATTGDTYRAAAALIDQGADPTYTINLEYHTHSFKRYKVLSLVYRKLMIYEGGIGLAAISLADYAKVGADPEDNDGIVENLMEVEEAEAVAFLREQTPGKINVSFRSKGAIDVSVIAREFGGGGHVQAAGCEFHEPLLSAKLKVLRALKEAPRVRKEA